MAPTKMEFIQSNLVSMFARNAVMITVIMKFMIVIREAAPMDLLMSLNCRLDPLSNKMMIRVIVVKTFPRCPKKSLVTIPPTGPIRMPIKSNSNTLGILVLSKSSLKACEKKIRRPSDITIVKMSMASVFLVDCANLYQINGIKIPFEFV